MGYGKMTENGVLISATPKNGYKPLIDTMPESREGYKAIAHYTDGGESIVQEWEYIPMSEDEIADINAMNEAHPTTETIMNILTGVSE